MGAEHNPARINPDRKRGYLRLVPSHALRHAYLIGISLFFIDLIFIEGYQSVQFGNGRQVPPGSRSRATTSPERCNIL
jgi:hypothetical protein